MTTRSEREKKHSQNEQYKQILAKLLAKEENKYCADCLAKGPRWVSWNLGVFLCIRCSGIHRSLGVHISKVKSVNLDTWTSDQVAKMCSRGNGWAKDKYEANLPKDFKRPNSDSSMEYFIRDKYEKLKYCSTTEVPLRSIEEFNIFSNSDNSNSRHSSKKNVSNGSSSIRLNKPADTLVPRPKPASASAAPRQPEKPHINGVAPTQKATSNVDDLLGFSSPVVSTTTTTTTVIQNTTAVSPETKPPPSADLTFDLFTSMQENTNVSGTAPVQNSFATADSQNVQPANEKKVMSKDSILSLYTQNQPMGMQPNPYVAGGFNMAGQPAMTYGQQPVAMTSPNIVYQNPAGYNMAQMNNVQQGMMGYPQHNMQAMQQQYQWQQQQMQNQMQNMQLGNHLNTARTAGGMRSHNSMPQMSPQQSAYGNQFASQGGLMNVPLQHNSLANSQPSLVGLDTSSSGWGTGMMNSGQTLSNQLWK